MFTKIKSKIFKLLRYSERYTKTDMVYLARGGFWLTVGQIISAGSSFLLAIAFANLLPKEIYGQYKYVLSIFYVLAITNLPGINIAVTRKVSQNIVPSITEILKIKMKWSLLGTLAGFVISGYYYFHGNQKLAAAFIIVAIFLLLVENLNIYNAYLHGQKKFSALTKFTSIVKIVTLLTTVIIIYFYQNIYLALLAIFVPQAIVRLIFFLKLKNKYSGNDNNTKSISRYGRQLSLINLISTIANRLDEILIFHYLGAVQLAVYAFAVAPTEQLKSLFKNVESLALPKFAQNNKEEIKKYIFKKSLKLSLIISIFIIIYIALAPWLYKLVFPQYLESVKYSQILALSLITIPIWLFQAAFKAQQMTKQIYKLEIFNSIIQIVLTFFLVANFGLWGAVTSRTAHRIVYLFISTWLMKKS